MSDSSTLQSWINILSNLSDLDFDIICDAVDVVKDIKNNNVD
jgi:hypothetical protein